MSTTKVFLVGITGYIGGSVFTALKKAHPDFTYTALVRNPDNVAAVEAAGATPVVGTFADRELIARHAYESDIVIGCAGPTDKDLIGGVLDGLKKRKAEGKGVGTFIHLGGTAVFKDGTKEGKFVEGGKVWSDANVDDIKNSPGDIHRPVFDAALAGDIIAYIVGPGAAHGTGTGPVKTAPSFLGQLAGMYQAAGRAYYVGEGSSVFEFIHISDLASLYVAVFDRALKGEDAGKSPYECYYMATAETITWKKVATLVGEKLHKEGKLQSPTAESAKFEEAGHLALYAGANVFIKAERGKQIGWVPSNVRFEDSMKA